MTDTKKTDWQEIVDCLLTRLVTLCVQRAIRPRKRHSVWHSESPTERLR